MTTTRDLAEPYLGDLFATFGLDVEYTRASANKLYRKDSDGREVEIIDYTGGFGSLILGHHHPRLVAEAGRVLGAGMPVHAQFSRRTEAIELAGLLNDIVKRELGETEDFTSVFANSGAEAIEVALKHAEMERVNKLATLRDDLEVSLHSARSRAVGSDTRISDELWRRFGLPASEHRSFDEFASAVDRANEDALAVQPVYLTVEGSFHGKLAGSVQLTHNEAFRAPFTALAAHARFLPFNDPSALRKFVDAEVVSAVEVLVDDDGVVGVRERTVPTLAAFVLEPILGEGGIREISVEFAREIQKVAAELDIPIVLDEIQSGMGRTGSFLASTHSGLRGDYYALAKSLGGGIAKISVVLFRTSRYQRAFEFVHSSTFAKDSFSSSIALKTLELLEADNGLAYEHAAERGRALRETLEGVHADFPDVIDEIRGRGLMLGVDFRSQADASSAFIRTKFQDGVFGWIISGYLLWEHNIRIAPTASATNSLRLEPSILLTDEEIARLDAALRELASVLRNQDALHLLYPISDRRIPKPRRHIIDFRNARSAGEPATLDTADDYRQFDSSLADLDDATLESHIARLGALVR
ncbi:aspartate aminotransferase family protein [Nocardia sp. NPDC059195]|uniref:aspartate aminotransferase family protein n=1 Tax=Nocardia sp. NPDC059195 TaxID=3346765 RepID=UPI0036C49D14